MQLIQNGPRRCDCHAKLEEFEANLNADGTYLHFGAVTRCDCGSEWKLTDTQFEGRCWRRIGTP